MDTVNREEGIMDDMERAGDSMEIGHAGEEVVKMDTLPEVVVMVMSSEGLEHKEMESGAVEVGKVMELEVGIKYCPGMETTLTYYFFTEFKAHSSKIWPDRNRFLTNKPSVAHTVLTGTTVSSAEHQTVRPVHTPRLET